VPSLPLPLSHCFNQLVYSIATERASLICVAGSSPLPSRSSVRRLSPSHTRGKLMDVVMLWTPGLWNEDAMDSIEYFCASTSPVHSQ
jgi:hypothetical protein